MATPLYNTDIIPLTSRPTLTVIDDGDYFVILDTSTGKISKILRTNIQKALNISYDNITSGLTAETVQAALDELAESIGDTDSALANLAGAGRTTETVKGNADAVALRELLSNKVTAFQEVPTDTAYPSEKLVDDSLKNLAGTGRTTETVKANADDIISIKGTGYTEGSLKSHEDRLDTLEGTGAGSVAKAIDDAVIPLAEVVDTNRLYSDSQYLALKAQADAQALEIQASRAELYNGYKILQFGSTDIIGKGTKADYSAIDVSANVVDGKLDIEQKGLTIRNLLVNGDFKNGFTSWGSSSTTPSVTNQLVSFTATARYGRIQQSIKNTNGNKFFISVRVKASSANVRLSCPTVEFTLNKPHSGSGEFEILTALVTSASALATVEIQISDWNTSGWAEIQVDGTYGCRVYNLTALGLSTITDTSILAKLLTYVDGTKSVGKMGIQILDADDNVTQTIFLPEVGNSLPNGVADSIKTVADGWEHSKRVSTPTSVGSGVAVNTTNYPTAKNGGQWVNELTSGGTEIGVVGTDSTTGAGMLRFELATPIVTKYDFPHLTSGKTIHRFAGEEKIALYGTGLTFSENVLTVLSAIKFVAGVMTDITSLATITTNIVTFSGVNATDVVYVKVEHDVDRPLGILEHTPAVSNTASRLAALEAAVFGG